MNRQIARGAAASVLFTATNVVVAVIQLRLVVRFLPQELAGLWLLFLTIGAYIVFFDLGISPTVGREMSFALGAAPSESSSRQLGELIATLKRVLGFVAVVSAFLGLLVGEILILNSSRYHENRIVECAWAIFSVGAGLNLFGGAALAGLFGLGKVATEKLIRSICLVIGIVLMATALLMGFGILGLSAAWFLQSLTVAVLGWWRLQRELPAKSQNSYGVNWSLARRLVSPSLKLALIQLGAVMILQSANPLLAIMLGTSAIPPYEAVSKIAITLMTLSVLIANSSAPYFSMSFAAGDNESIKKLLVWNLQFGLGIIIVLASFVAVYGDRIVAVWLGPSMFAGFAVLWVLLVMVVLEVHHVIFSTAVMAAGKIAFVGPALIAGVLNILLAIVLTSRLGLLGLAIAIAASQMLTNNWYAPYVGVRLFAMSLKVLSLRVWLPLVLLSVFSLTMDFQIRRLPWFSGKGLASLSASLLTSSVIGAAFWFFVVLPRDERTRLNSFLLRRFSVAEESV